MRRGVFGVLGWMGPRYMMDATKIILYASCLNFIEPTTTFSSLASLSAVMVIFPYSVFLASVNCLRAICCNPDATSSFKEVDSSASGFLVKHPASCNIAFSSQVTIVRGKYYV